MVTFSKGSGKALPAECPILLVQLFALMADSPVLPEPFGRLKATLSNCRKSTVRQAHQERTPGLSINRITPDYLNLAGFDGRLSAASTTNE